MSLIRVGYLNLNSKQNRHSQQLHSPIYVFLDKKSIRSVRIPYCFVFQYIATDIKADRLMADTSNVSAIYQQAPKTGCFLYCSRVFLFKSLAIACARLYFCGFFCQSIYASFLSKLKHDVRSTHRRTVGTNTLHHLAITIEHLLPAIAIRQKLL